MTHWMETRKEASSRLSQLAFPTRKQEEYKYLNLKELRETSWQPAGETSDLAQVKALIERLQIESYQTLVLINGELRADLSTAVNGKGLEVFEMQSALTDAAWYKWRDAQRSTLNGLGAAADYFDEVSESHLGRGFALRIKEMSHIQILSFATGSAKEAIHAPYQIWVDIARGAKASVVEWQGSVAVGDVMPVWLHPQILVKQENSSALEWVSYQSLQKTDFSVGRTRILQEEGADLRSLEISTGGKLFRRNLDVHLLGAGATATLNGLSLTGAGQVCDFHTFIDHSVGHCSTNQLYKGVLGEGSQTVFNGKVLIRHGAQKASSEQLNKNLLLSSSAEIDSKPELEIHADDVKATHGSAIGQLNDEEIFYLQSRAISADLAKEILALGFVEDLIMDISSQEVIEKLRPELRAAFSSLMQVEGTQ